MEDIVLKEFIQNHVKDMSAPSVGVLVIYQGEVVVNDAFGYADVENEVAAHNRSVFRLASVTKHITALAILRLIEQGQLMLESTAADLLPEYDGIDEHITVQMLLNHTSGLANFTDIEEFAGAFSLVDKSHKQVLEFFLDKPLGFTPGTQYSYSNSGYYLLGVIIETLSGMSYGEYLEQEFFIPLGMTQTGYDDSRKIIPHRVRGYSTEQGSTPETGLTNCEYASMKTPFAAGGLCSSPTDMVTWCKAMLAGNLVNQELLNKAQTPPLLKNSETNYGFGLACFEQNGVSFLTHDGGIMGFASEFVLMPDQNSAIFAVANDECCDLSELVGSFIRTYIFESTD